MGILFNVGRAAVGLASTPVGLAIGAGLVGLYVVNRLTKKEVHIHCKTLTLK